MVTVKRHSIDDPKKISKKKREELDEKACDTIKTKQRKLDKYHRSARKIGRALVKQGFLKTHSYTPVPFFKKKAQFDIP